VPGPEVAKPSAACDDLGDFLQIDGDRLSATLTAQGYYTLGTTAGLAAGGLDNNEPLSYGHPYARCSFPELSIDGQRRSLHQWLFPRSSVLQAFGDTLLHVSAGDPVGVRVAFPIRLRDEVARLEWSLANLDSLSHQVGADLVFDPALGAWGDGYAETQGLWFDDSQSMAGTDADGLLLHERREAPLGMGLTIRLVGEAPDSLRLANWVDTVVGGAPATLDLYDLALCFQWAERTLAPGDSLVAALDLALLEPDFPPGLFLRADLPGALSIE
jgi:hypothetical protein